VRVKRGRCARPEDPPLHKLYSLDATVIDLCAQVFDRSQLRAAKGAMKLHPLLAQGRQNRDVSE